MPARTGRRAVVNTPGKTKFERSARRWYIRKKPSILYGCKVVTLSVITVVIFLQYWTQDKPQKVTPSLHCIPRTGDFQDSTDPLYRSYIPLDPPKPPFPVLVSAPDVSIDCLEEWIATGRTSCGAPELDTSLDLIWTWVNGSDAKWKEELVRVSKEEGIFSPGFHFREQNELQYSMRSVMAAMSSSIDTIHLVVADLPSADMYDLDNGRRIAQTPHWLDFRRVGCNHERPRFQLSTHHEIFRLPKRIARDERKEEDWRENALPTFNSKVIESRFGWLPGLGEAVLSFNDDFFMLQPHTTADFYSKLYGTVIRFDDGFYQQVRPVLDKRNLNDAGETGGLWHANYLLSKRFPKRLRPYLPHVPKVVTRSLHHEANLMFEDHLFNSTQRRFRESTKGTGDIQLQWLLISLRVERWREALLWTFIVANLGTRDAVGILGPQARTELGKVIGAKDGDRVEVLRGKRSTLDGMNENLVRAGLPIPEATEMLFSSMDGHLPSIPRPGIPSSDDRCTLDLDKCFGAFWSLNESASAVDVFKRMTFEHPDCGDCLIMALVTASGPLGLSAFLPDPRTTFVNRPSTKRLHMTPVLPVTDIWQAGDFTLNGVMGDTEKPGPVDVRLYTVKLLSRYQYVSGRSETEFHMINNPDHAARALGAIDPKAVMLGLNDNIERDGDETKSVMTDWFQQRWPERTTWERL